MFEVEDESRLGREIEKPIALARSRYLSEIDRIVEAVEPDLYPALLTAAPTGRVSQWIISAARMSARIYLPIMLIEDKKIARDRPARPTRRVHTRKCLPDKGEVWAVEVLQLKRLSTGVSLVGAILAVSPGLKPFAHARRPVGSSAVQHASVGVEALEFATGAGVANHV